MIKVDIPENGNAEINIEGSIVDLLNEYTVITNKLIGMMTRQHDEGFALRTIGFCVHLAKMPKDQLNKEMKAEENDEAHDRKSVD